MNLTKENGTRGKKLNEKLMKNIARIHQMVIISRRLHEDIRSSNNHNHFGGGRDVIKKRILLSFYLVISSLMRESIL